MSAEHARGFVRSTEETLVAWRAWRLVRGVFESPDGEVFERSYVRSPGAVGIVAVSMGHVALLRQYRPSLDRMNALLDYLTAHCCQGEPCDLRPERAGRAC